MNLLLYGLIALVVMLVSSVWEIYENGYVMYAVLFGVIWPLTLFGLSIMLILLAIFAVFATLTECLEFVAIKIAKAFKISKNNNIEQI
ncbi:MAG: hypothetical protein K0R54_222 [Clostridiaceae bacterium]|jgi:hypothetical protein|nr:hypothetical protein [Clostridiaceae bacterium]